MHVQRYTFRSPGPGRVLDGNRPLCSAPETEPYGHAEDADCAACFALLPASAMRVPRIRDAAVRAELDALPV